MRTLVAFVFALTYASDVAEFIPRDIELGGGASTTSLRVLIPTRHGERAITTAADFHASVALAWDAVVEPNQGGLVDAKVQHLPIAPLTAGESWHHRAAAKAGVLDSARFLITFSVVPALQAGGERIHLAAARGDVAGVLTELAAGVDAGLETSEAATPALLAAAVGASDVLSALADAGADIDARGFAGATPLMVAASMGHVEAVSRLISLGADARRAHDFAGTTALHFAAEMGRTEVIRVLCKNGNADSRARTRTGGQPLHTAADTNQSSAAAVLLADCGADHTALLAGDSQPLYMAAQRGYTDVVKVLAAAGADLDYVMPRGAFTGALVSKDDGGDFDAPPPGAFYSEKNTKIGNGATALHAAVENGHLDTVRCMLELGAKQLTSMEGASPLLLSIQYKHPQIAFACLNVSDVLVSAHVNARTPHDGTFALLASIDYGYESVADAIIAAGADVTLSDKRGRTALSAALSARRDKLAAKLLVSGALGADDDYASVGAEGRRGGAAAAFSAAIATKNSPALSAILRRAQKALLRDNVGGAALRSASAAGWVEGVEALLSAGALASRSTLEAASASASDGAARVVELLVKHGVQAKSASSSESSSLHIAAGHATVATVQALIASGADVGSRTRKSQEVPLHAAAARGSADVIKALVAAGAAVGARSVTGHTPLHSAVLGGHVPAIRALLDAGARVDSADDNGRTGLHHCVASRHCAPSVVMELLNSGADTSTCDTDRRSVLEIALSSDRDAVRDKPGLVRTLVQKGASGACSDKRPSSRAPLRVAIDAGADAPLLSLINVTRDVGGESAVRALFDAAPGALAAAAKAGWVAGVNILLSAGADKDSRNEDGRSARDEALASRNADIIKLLG